MDKKRLLELAGVQLNEQLDQEQEFVGYSLTRDDIASLLNYYFIDEDGYGTPEMREAMPRFEPGDKRLTDEACREFVGALADMGMEGAMGDNAPETVEYGLYQAFPKLARRLEVAKKRQG